MLDVSEISRLTLKWKSSMVTYTYTTYLFVRFVIAFVFMYNKMQSCHCVPARLGKGQGAKEIGHNLAREQPKFGHNLMRERHIIGHSLERE